MGKINQEVIDKQIIIMKKSIAKLVRLEDKEYIGTIEKFNQRIVLAVANFKCQKPDCGGEKDLQIHHLIMRSVKDYVDFWRYASQRYYWANQIILCKKCHRRIHNELGKDIGEDSLCITEKRINEIKKFFKKQEEKNEK